MHAVAQGELDAGGRVIRRSSHPFVDLEVATRPHRAATSPTHAHRKALIGSRADAFIALLAASALRGALRSPRLADLSCTPSQFSSSTPTASNPVLAFLDHCVAEGMLKP